MLNFIKRLFLCVFVLCVVFAGILFADKYTLQSEIVRLHIVGNSNSEYDQLTKLKIRDAVLEYLEGVSDLFADKESAMRILDMHIADIKEVAEGILKDRKSDSSINVFLSREAFESREYETFSLPSGVYDTLRISIGEAKGDNWWCVAFPSLCAPKTADAFADNALSCGFSPELIDALTDKKGNNVRFFFLDLFGKIEKAIFNTILFVK